MKQGCQEANRESSAEREKFIAFRSDSEIDAFCAMGIPRNILSRAERLDEPTFGR